MILPPLHFCHLRGECLIVPSTELLVSTTFTRSFVLLLISFKAVDALILPGLVWGRLSRRGEESRKRLNIIHGRYAHTSNGVIMVLMSMIDSLEVFRARMDLPSWSNLEWNSLYWIMRDQMIAMGVSPNDLAMNWRDELSKHRSRMRNMKCGHWSVIARMVDHSLEAYLERFPPEARRQLRQLLAVACPEEMLVGIGFDKSYPADDDFYALKETIQMIHLEEEDRLRRPHCLSAHFEIHGSKPRFEVFGPHDRSRNMPQILTDSHSSIADLRPRSDNHMASYRRNLGYATNQPPVRGVEDVLLPDNLPKVSREEVALHCTTELGYWVIIGSYVYDVSILVEDDLHPGGGDVLRKYAGQDASGIVKVHSEDARIVACNYIVAKVLGSAGDVRR
jgi:cytochrome b involved in lipid metabolism